MGVDIMFKMRHNLDVSSVDILAIELQHKLSYNVRGFINPVDIDILEDLGIPYPIYNSDEVEESISVEDEYIVARSLIAAYGNNVIEQVVDKPKYQYYIGQINEVNRGLYSYTINHDSFTKFGMPSIWRITNNTISGAPGFGNERWVQFSYALDHNLRFNNEYLVDLIDSRRQLYEFLKPLIIDKYIYYHADQGQVEELSWMNYFDDIPEFLAKINFEVFDLSEYILNKNSIQIFNSQDLNYIIRDDFKDFK